LAKPLIPVAQKSASTEELTAEMANLEGLMKDLNAITQHEFQCWRPWCSPDDVLLQSSLFLVRGPTRECSSLYWAVWISVSGNDQTQRQSV